MVYDWSTQKCEDNDITTSRLVPSETTPGKIQLMNTHQVNYRWIASTTIQQHLHASLYQDDVVEQQLHRVQLQPQGMACLAVDPGREVQRP